MTSELMRGGLEGTGGPTIVEIALRAYDLYCNRGRQHGHDLDDWLAAERELEANRAGPVLRIKRDRRSRSESFAGPDRRARV